MENDKQPGPKMKVEDKTPSGKVLTLPRRQIIIETDGNNIDIVKTEVSGSIELAAILRHVLAFISNNKQNGS